MKQAVTSALIIVATIGLGGCGANLGLGSLMGASTGPAPLPAAPVAPVQSGSLAPLVVAPVQTPPSQAGQIVGATSPATAGAVSTTPPGLPPAPGQPGLPPVPGQPTVAGQTPPVPGTPPATPAVAEVPVKPVDADKAVAVSRTDLMGGWTLRSSGDQCALTLSLTQWSGGYRASARGCNTPDLQRISAWSLDGKQVTLRGADGGTVATLYATTKEQYNGVTSGRRGISFSR